MKDVGDRKMNFFRLTVLLAVLLMGTSLSFGVAVSDGDGKLDKFQFMAYNVETGEFVSGIPSTSESRSQHLALLANYLKLTYGAFIEKFPELERKSPWVGGGFVERAVDILIHPSFSNMSSSLNDRSKYLGWYGSTTDSSLVKMLIALARKKNKPLTLTTKTGNGFKLGRHGERPANLPEVWEKGIAAANEVQKSQQNFELGPPKGAVLDLDDTMEIGSGSVSEMDDIPQNIKPPEPGSPRWKVSDVDDAIVLKQFQPNAGIRSMDASAGRANIALSLIMDPVGTVRNMAIVGGGLKVLQKVAPATGKVVGKWLPGLDALFMGIDVGYEIYWAHKDPAYFRQYALQSRLSQTPGADVGYLRAVWNSMGDLGGFVRAQAALPGESVTAARALMGETSVKTILFNVRQGDQKIIVLVDKYGKRTYIRLHLTPDGRWVEEGEE